jgi:hypothetical protein
LIIHILGREIRIAEPPDARPHFQDGTLAIGVPWKLATSTRKTLNGTFIKADGVSERKVEWTRVCEIGGYRFRYTIFRVGRSQYAVRWRED